MAVYKYREFKISVSEDSVKVQGLRVGDIVRRQYFNGQGVIYTLMCVLKTGSDQVQVEENGTTTQKKRDWFIGALLEGDAPQSNEVLDFVRVTNLWDANRLGAIYMTASDDESPYIDVIDGIAVEKSLCYPTSINEFDYEDDFSQYHIEGKQYVSSGYIDNEGDCYRVCKLTKNATAIPAGTFVGLSQSISESLENPERVLVSYKIKSSRNISGIVATLEYEDGTRIDGTVSVDSGTDWQYKFHAITLGYSGRYKRAFKLNIGDGLQNGDEVCISDLNVILLSSIANFAGGMKLRIGKLSGITDPVFGDLEDYGAYMQRLYATKQVNISGTLTAGDENGFAATFYAGKIHKNVVINSIACDFSSQTSISVGETSPVGIGEVYESEDAIVLNAQTNSWTLGKLGKRYCFSFWAKSEDGCDALVSQNGNSIKTIAVRGGNSWARYYVAFDIRESKQSGEPLKLEIEQSGGKLYFTAPQLESGNYATQYQPTDDVLSYIEDYGAWFNKGGIGGTIQNPLLKFGSDGSISSKNGSFVIKNDGSGHFANGRFSWNEDSIVLQGITIKWEDIDEEGKEQLKPKSIRILGQGAFVMDKDVWSPSSITLQIEETNFVSAKEDREWYYMNDTGEYVLLEGQNDLMINISPTASYWGDRQMLTVKAIVEYDGTQYSDTFSLQKIKNGEQSYLVQIVASNGTVFKNGNGTTVLTAYVYKGSDDVTSTFQKSAFSWVRTSNDTESDSSFNASHVGYGNALTVAAGDVDGTASFDCEVSVD